MQLSLSGEASVGVWDTLTRQESYVAMNKDEFDTNTTGAGSAAERDWLNQHRLIRSPKR